MVMCFKLPRSATPPPHPTSTLTLPSALEVVGVSVEVELALAGTAVPVLATPALAILTKEIYVCTPFLAQSLLYGLVLMAYLIALPGT